MLSMERFRQQDLQAGRKVTRLWVAFWIVLLFGVPESVPAQALQTIRLTLRDAVQLALQQNSQVQIANLNLAQSEEFRKLSRLRFAAAGVSRGI